MLFERQGDNHITWNHRQHVHTSSQPKQTLHTDSSRGDRLALHAHSLTVKSAVTGISQAACRDRTLTLPTKFPHSNITGINERRQASRCCGAVTASNLDCHSSAILGVSRPAVRLSQPQCRPSRSVCLPTASACVCLPVWRGAAWCRCV